MQRGEVKNKCDSKLRGCIESELRNIAGNVFDFFAKSFAFRNGTNEMVQRTTCATSTTTDSTIYDYYNFFLCHSYYG